MRPINKAVLERILKDNANKRTPCTSDPELLRQFINSNDNFFNYSWDNTKAYEVSLWVSSNENLIACKNKTSNYRYKSKQILLVDLGPNTFGWEFSYEHPCIVLYNEYNRLFVVPCSSQPIRHDKYGNICPENMEAKISDGFKKNTTVMLNEAKFIDKTRVKSIIGNVGNTFFTELNNRMFKMLFLGKNNLIEALRRDETALKAANDSLTTIAETKEQQLEQLKEDLMTQREIVARLQEQIAVIKKLYPVEEAVIKKIYPVEDLLESAKTS